MRMAQAPLIGVAFLLAACGAGDPQPPEASALLQQTREAMLSVESMRAEGSITSVSEREGEKETLITIAMASSDLFYNRSEFVGQEEPSFGESLYVDGVVYTRSDFPPGFNDWRASDVAPPTAEGPAEFLMPPEGLAELTAEGATFEDEYAWVLRGQVVQSSESPSGQGEIVEPQTVEWTVFIDPETKWVLQAEIDMDNGVQRVTDTATGTTRTFDHGTTRMVFRGSDYNEPVAVDVPDDLSAPTPTPSPTPRGVPFEQTLRFEPDGVLAPEQWDEVTEILDERLASIGAGGFELGVGVPPGVLTLVLAANSLTEEEARYLVERVGRFDFIERRCSAHPCEEDANHEDIDVGIGNADVIEARAARNPLMKEPSIQVTLHAEASMALAELSQRLYESRTDSDTPDHLAFAMDGEVLVSAVVQSPITSGRLQVNGDFTTSEAEVFAALIASEPLPVALRFVGAE